MIRWQGIAIDRSKRMIAHDGDAIHLSGLRFRLASALLLGGPMSKETLFDLLYDDREDGGPLGGRELISVLLSQIKSRLARIGLELHADGPYGRRLYWAEPINRKAGDAIERRERNSCVTESDLPLPRLRQTGRPLLPQNQEGPL